MTSLFADTFYWIAVTDSADASHHRAMALTNKLHRIPLVTTDEVLIEFLTFFAGSGPALRFKAAGVVQYVLSAPGVRVIPQSRASFLAGLGLYEQRPDKGYSLTDCISMQTMRREGIVEALTTDRHFEQEGFRALFRDS